MLMTSPIAEASLRQIPALGDGEAVHTQHFDLSAGEQSVQQEIFEVDVSSSVVAPSNAERTFAASGVEGASAERSFIHTEIFETDQSHPGRLSFLPLQPIRDGGEQQDLVSESSYEVVYNRFHNRGVLAGAEAQRNMQGV